MWEGDGNKSFWGAQMGDLGWGAPGMMGGGPKPWSPPSSLLSLRTLTIILLFPPPRHQPPRCHQCVRRAFAQGCQCLLGAWL